MRDSGRFPLCGRGDVNTYAIFAETNRTVMGLDGRVGCILPSGIALDDTTKYFFQDLMDTGSLVSLFSFENESYQHQSAVLNDDFRQSLLDDLLLSDRAEVKQAG